MEAAPTGGGGNPLEAMAKGAIDKAGAGAAGAVGADGADGGGSSEANTARSVVPTRPLFWIWLHLAGARNAQNLVVGRRCD